MPIAWNVFVPLNLSGFGWSTIACVTFFPVADSAQRTDSAAAEGRNCVSIMTSASGPSIQYEAVSKPHAFETYVPTRGSPERESVVTAPFGIARAGGEPHAARTARKKR